jgi:hypothetical protein
MRRHKWRKANFNDYRLVEDLETGKKHQIQQPYECIHCGLLKAHCRTMSYFPKLVYFRYDRIVSVERVPAGGCNPELGKIEREFVEAQKQGGYFSPTDFMID